MADPFVNTIAILRDELGTLRIVELKHVLEQLNLSRTGNKADLVERVAHYVQMRHQYVAWCACMHMGCGLSCVDPAFGRLSPTTDRSIDHSGPKPRPHTHPS